MADRGFNGELDVAYSSPQEFGQAVIAWLTEGIRFLAGDISDEILAIQPPPKVGYVYDNPYEDVPTRVVPPLWGEVSIEYGQGKFYSKPYSRTSLNRLQALAPECTQAWISLEQAAGGELSQYRLGVERMGGASGYARLLVTIPAASISRDDCPEVMFMRGFAERRAPAFGHISPESGSVVGDTQLELALGLYVGNSLREWDRYLRGYSWVTVIPDVLAARLGGAAGLRETGAFAIVDVLAGGSVWLQATPRLDEYRQEQIDRVFDALAPALPPGMPGAGQVIRPAGRGVPELRVPYLLSLRDAQDYAAGR